MKGNRWTPKIVFHHASLFFLSLSLAQALQQLESLQDLLESKDAELAQLQREHQRAKDQLQRGQAATDGENWQAQVRELEARNRRANEELAQMGDRLAAAERKLAAARRLDDLEAQYRDMHQETLEQLQAAVQDAERAKDAQHQAERQLAQAGARTLPTFPPPPAAPSRSLPSVLVG